MKKLIFSILLTASVWSSFSYACTDLWRTNFTVNGYPQNPVTITPSPVNYALPCGLTEAQALIYLREMAWWSSPYYQGWLFYFTDNEGRATLRSPDESQSVALRLRVTKYQSNTEFQETITCPKIEGAWIDGFHNSLDDFCAIVGTTGGESPEPLICIATNVSEIPSGSGNYQHAVSPQSCTAPTGPTAPDDGGTDPEPPCTENCEPTDPETPPTGGNDGSDIPSTGGGANSSTTTVTGTQTDSQGNVTNINMTMEQDYSPITTRQDETNQRLEAENQNSSTIVGQLAELLEKVTGIGQGAIEISDKLDGVTDAINGIDTSTDLSGVEDKLDGIKDAIGTPQEGEAAGNSAELPDVETAINDGFDAIQDAMNTETNNQLTAGLENIGDKLTAFESIPQLFEFASQSCSPITLGDRSLNLCSYAATSSSVLSWVLTMLTIIFLVTSVIADIKRVRLT